MALLSASIIFYIWYDRSPAVYIDRIYNRSGVFTEQLGINPK